MEQAALKWLTLFSEPLFSILFFRSMPVPSALSFEFLGYKVIRLFYLIF